jgi:hypothetical protein
MRFDRRGNLFDLAVATVITLFRPGPNHRSQPSRAYRSKYRPSFRFVPFVTAPVTGFESPIGPEAHVYGNSASNRP